MTTNVAEPRDTGGARSAVLGVLQRVGRSLMMPIAVLPAAALLLRFGQPDMLGKDGLGAHAVWINKVADLLQVRQCSPVLYIERHAYSGQTLVEYSVASYRADRYKLWVPLARPGPRITNPRR